MSVRPREFRIARKQWRVERFGERNVGAVVSGQRFAQLPDARQELPMSVALQDEASKIIQRLLCPSWRDVFELDQPAQGLRDLDVEQMRSVESLMGRKGPSPDVFRPVGAQKQIKDRGGIDDDQRLSRSARTIWVGDALPV